MITPVLQELEFIAMQSFKEFINRRLLCETSESLLLEYEVYRLIPGTKNSYRQDSGNTNTLTQQHSHVYAKPAGAGKELYAVNFGGSGHDGSSGTQIPNAHADYFRSLGYRIPPSNILESILSGSIDSADFSLLIIDETPPEGTGRFLRLFNEEADA